MRREAVNALLLNKDNININALRKEMRKVIKKDEIFEE